MNIDEIVAKAVSQNKLDNEQTAQEFYQRTIAWFHYLGILRHNAIDPKRYHVHLKDVLKAAKLEPRIYELLPAVMILIPQAIDHEPNDIPVDLKRILKNIRARKATGTYQNVPATKYLHWLNADIMHVARRRLEVQTQPRRRSNSHLIGNIVRSGRIKLAMTQKTFAEVYKVSLHVIRDLEQGKMSPSLQATNDILKVLGRTLRA